MRCVYQNQIFIVFSVKEEVFWRNYFYRVSLIKQSAQLTALAAQQQAVRKDKNSSEEEGQLAGKDFSGTHISLWDDEPFLIWLKNKHKLDKVVLTLHNRNSYGRIRIPLHTYWSCIF